MQVKRFAVVAGLALVAGTAIADSTIQLRVSATVPPRPCEFPDQCEPVDKSTPTRVRVEQGVVRYIGSTPDVTGKDDLLTVIF